MNFSLAFQTVSGLRAQQVPTDPMPPPDPTRGPIVPPAPVDDPDEPSPPVGDPESGDPTTMPEPPMIATPIGRAR